MLLLLLAVLVATRWCGRSPAMPQRSTCAGLAIAMLGAAFGRVPPTGADVAALGLLCLLGAGIATWTGRRFVRRTSAAPTPDA